MEDKPDREVCREVCACLHSALISGSDECMYESGELDFWYDKLGESDDIVEVISPEGFEATFIIPFKDGKEDVYHGEWFKVMSVITGESIYFLGELAEELELYILTDGKIRIGFYKRIPITAHSCPILPYHLLDEVFEHARNFGDFSSEEVEEVYQIYKKREMEFRQERNDVLPRLNRLRACECSYCGELGDDEDYYYDEDGDCYVCDECFREYFQECEHCNSYHDTDILHWDEVSRIYLCEVCMEYEYSYCDGCGDLFDNDSIVYDAETGDNYCDDCWSYLLSERKKAKLIKAPLQCEGCLWIRKEEIGEVCWYQGCRYDDFSDNIEGDYNTCHSEVEGYTEEEVESKFEKEDDD